MTDTTATRPARCYMEFCCNTATLHVVVANRSGNPAMPAIAWGWCTQHVADAWEHRVGQVCQECAPTVAVPCICADLGASGPNQRHTGCRAHDAAAV